MRTVTLRRATCLLAVVAGTASAGAGARGQAGPEERPRPAAARETPAPKLPESFYGLPRLPRGGVPPGMPPLAIHLGSGRESVCYSPEFSGARPEAARLPLPAVPGGGPRAVTLVELARDPTRGIRYLAYDGGEGFRGEMESGPGSPGISESDAPWRLEAVSVTEEEKRCAPVVASAPIGVQDGPGRERPGPNAGATFVRVELRDADGGGVVWGWCLSAGRGGGQTSSATRNPSRGATQSWTLSSYLTQDGRAVALALSMSAVWTDPRDGRDYQYLQVGGAGFGAVSPEGFSRLALAAGPAAPYAVEVAAFAEPEWAGCQSRASRRSPFARDR